jgi:glucose-6-phosphate isomerase
MPEPTSLPVWAALLDHARAVAPLRMRDLFDADPDRFARFHLRLGDMVVDYAKNRITTETMGLLVDLARQAGVEARRDAMFGGKPINVTEGRAVLHVALRDPTDRPVLVDGEDVKPGIRAVLARMEAFSEAVRSWIRKPPCSWWPRRPSPPRKP